MGFDVLMIDNYDSFTYNIVQYLGELGARVKVVRSKEVDMDSLIKISPPKVIISPGPGWPEEAGVSIEAIIYFSGKCPILGVCLGHQCIGQAFGAKIRHAKRIMHGKVSLIKHNGKGLFKGVPQGFKATRYHSLVIDEKTLPKEFLVSAKSEDNEIMAIEHKKLPVFGVQFHPESILTEYGKKILENFLKETG